MASIKISSNATVVLNKIVTNLGKLKDPAFLRPVCIELIPMITERIHERGMDADGRQIGTYSPAYLKYARKKAKRGPSPTVIVSLTRKLENSWAAVPTKNGYGIGFIDAGGGAGSNGAISSKQKLLYVAARKNANLTSLSKDETAFAIERINELVHEAISS